MSVKLNSSGGGSITLQEPSTASNRTLTLPDNTGNLISSADSGTITQGMLASGVAGKGPVFRVAKTDSAQSLTINVNTKITFNSVVFDTNSNFSVANSRFTPTVAGYYIFQAVNQLLGSITTAVDFSLYKNGVRDSALFYLTGSYSNPIFGGGAIIYCNGTTDYVELYCSVATAGISVNYTAAANYFTGALVRAA